MIAKLCVKLPLPRLITGTLLVHKSNNNQVDSNFIFACVSGYFKKAKNFPDSA